MKLGTVDSMSQCIVSHHIKTLGELIRTCLYGFYIRLSVILCEHGLINTIFKSKIFKET